jgi:hypothetical protein
MDIRELYWAAGFYEGEGAMAGFGVGGKGHHISVGQKNDEPLLRLQRLFGGQIYYPHDPTKKGRIPSWDATGTLARSVLMTLFPLLSQRRQAQITKHLTPWLVKTDHGGKYRALATHCKRGHAYTEENVYLNQHGGRGCRTCKSLYAKSEAEQRKQEARKAWRNQLSLPSLL